MKIEVKMSNEMERPHGSGREGERKGKRKNVSKEETAEQNALKEMVATTITE